MKITYRKTCVFLDQKPVLWIHIFNISIRIQAFVWNKLPYIYFLSKKVTGTVYLISCFFLLGRISFNRIEKIGEKKLPYHKLEKVQKKYMIFQFVVSFQVAIPDPDPGQAIIYRYDWVWTPDQQNFKKRPNLCKSF